MKVCITGAGGFIGSHLTEKCVELGYDVRAFVQYNSRNSWEWLEDSWCKNEIEVVLGDIRDFDFVYDALRGCQMVFHLAALISIPHSYVTPLAFVRTNVEGTYNVLQASRYLELENVLITSTSETYGTAQYVPIDEQHPMVGQSPYSASKIAADQLAISYYRTYGLPVKIVRPFNTYGPRQSARAIIPTIITQILTGNRRVSIGNIHPTRDLTYVKDSVNGFIEISKAPELVGEVTNIGMNEEISIIDLIKLISKMMNNKVGIISEKERVRPENSEVERLVCNNSKISHYTNWKPEYNLGSGLSETIEWLKNHFQIYKPGIYNI